MERAGVIPIPPHRKIIALEDCGLTVNSPCNLNPFKAKSAFHLKVSLSVIDRELQQKNLELMLELYREKMSNSNLIWLQFLSFVVIVERNLSYVPDMRDQLFQQHLMKEFLKYVQQNLKRPDQLKLQVVARRFNVSPNKLGSYVKAQSGCSVKQLITKNRMLVIGELIVRTKRSFSELAYEFGFFDESHLTKAFKQYYKQTPSAFRRLNSRKPTVPGM